MKRRMLIIVGSLAILVVTWVVSWNKYQETRATPSKEEEGKTSGKPLRYKRLPANGRTAASLILNYEDTDDNDDSDFVSMRRKEAAQNDFKVSLKKVFNQGQFKYALVENLSVVSVDQRSSYSPEEIVEEKFNKLIVRKFPTLDDGSLVVHNVRTKRLGILTGVLKIKLNDHSQWSEIQNEHRLTLEGNFPGIRLTLLKTTDLDSIDSLLSQLSSDSRIERVELEILESQAVPK